MPTTAEPPERSPEDRDRRDVNRLNSGSREENSDEEVVDRYQVRRNVEPETWFIFDAQDEKVVLVLANKDGRAEERVTSLVDAWNGKPSKHDPRVYDYVDEEVPEQEVEDDEK